METALKQIQDWTAELETLWEKVAPRFGRVGVRRRAGGFLRGLLSAAERKNGWQLAEQAGDTTPDGMQRLLNHARWDADEVRDDLRDYVVEHLGDRGGVLVVDETGFLKKGTKSAGVQRQYSGTAGRIENCQIGVFLAYASRHGHALVDRELYLPESWTTDRRRCREAGIPDQVGFQTKPQLARRMLERALDARVPVAWVTADAVYGGDGRLRRWLEEHDLAQVLAVNCNQSLVSGLFCFERADQLAARIPAGAWRHLSAGQGTKGERRSMPGPGWPSGRCASLAGATGCWCAAASPAASWPTTSARARPRPAWPSWSRWRECAGRWSALCSRSPRSRRTVATEGRRSSSAPRLCHSCTRRSTSGAHQSLLVVPSTSIHAWASTRRPISQFVPARRKDQDDSPLGASATQTRRPDSQERSVLRDCSVQGARWSGSSCAADGPSAADGSHGWARLLRSPHADLRAVWPGQSGAGPILSCLWVAPCRLRHGPGGPQDGHGGLQRSRGVHSAR